MKRTLIAATIGLLAAGLAWAQPYGSGGGMMGGYGQGGYGMGPGMMGGYGMGQGMMGGGGYGMGPGMMGGGYGAGFWGLDLSPEQRKRIAQIRDETMQAQWKLMGDMHQQRFHMHDFFGPGALDEQAARKAFQAMTETQKAMFENSLQARKRIDAVLTKEQREQLRRSWGER